MCDQKNGGDHDDDVDELSASDESEPEEQPSSAAFVAELDDDDDDDDDDNDREVVTSVPAVGAQSSFSLRGGGSAFSNRSHSIFDCLDSVAGLTSSSSSLKQDNVTDGVFARPLPPPPSRKTSQPLSSCPTPAKKKGAPDYLVHPERWTHYSLEDVSETSDQGNSRAALHYLSSLQQRKEQQGSQSDPSCNTQQKMIFRPSRLQKEQPAQSSFVKGREKETRLSHLEEEEEDEEGREEPVAGGRRTEPSVEQAEEKERDEEKDLRRAMGQAEEKEKGEEEKIEEANTGFTSFRKTKHKNYRRSSGQDEN